MEQHSFKIIFFDINKTIIDEKKVIKDGDELKKEIKERFKFLDSIINNFIDTHLLIDVENEEKFSLKQTYFIYQIEKGVTKSYYFYLVRKLDIKIFNNIINAVFIIIDLEKDNSIELLKSLFEINKNNEKLKIYMIGTYKEKEEIKLNRENIIELFIDQPYEYKYMQININNENNSYIDKKIGKFIEEAMYDVYLGENGEDNIKIIKKSNNMGEHEDYSNSGCSLF